MSNKQILIVDIETTGFNPNTDLIVEIGIVSLDLETGEIKKLYDKVVYEEGMTRDIMVNSWIFQKGYMGIYDFKKAVPLVPELPKIQNLIKCYPLGITAFNKQFDISFLRREGLEINDRLPCIMESVVDTVKCPPTPKMIAAGRNHYKNPNAQEAYDFFFPDNKEKPDNEKYIEKHRGGDDAFHEAMICFAAYKLGVFKLK